MALPAPLEYPPRFGEEGVVVQVKVVPATPDVRVVAAEPLEQSVCAAGVAVVWGVGFTVTTTGSGVPGQLFAVGVTV